MPLLVVVEVASMKPRFRAPSETTTCGGCTLLPQTDIDLATENVEPHPKVADEAERWINECSWTILLEEKVAHPGEEIARQKRQTKLANWHLRPPPCPPVSHKHGGKFCPAGLIRDENAECKEAWKERSGHTR